MLWRCNTCQARNFGHFENCVRCGTVRPRPAPPTKPKDIPLPEPEFSLDLEARL
jgi:hypothetical protein